MKDLPVYKVLQNLVKNYNLKRKSDFEPYYSIIVTMAQKCCPFPNFLGSWTIYLSHGDVCEGDNTYYKASIVDIDIYIDIIYVPWIHRNNK